MEFFQQCFEAGALILIPDKLEQLELKLEKLLGFRNTQEKLENC